MKLSDFLTLKGTSLNKKGCNVFKLDYSDILLEDFGDIMFSEIYLYFFILARYFLALFFLISVVNYFLNFSVEGSIFKSFS